MKVTYGKAIGDALKEEMRRDSKVLIYGEDIAEFGNIFGLTRGMLEEFGPKRVRNTPITETAIIGSAIVKIVAQYGEDAGSHIYDYVSEMVSGLAQV